MAAPVAVTLSDRIGWRLLAAAGLALRAAGRAWIAALAGAHAAYGRDVVPFVLAGVGVSMAIPSTSSAALGACGPS